MLSAIGADERTFANIGRAAGGLVVASRAGCDVTGVTALGPDEPLGAWSPGPPVDA